MTITLSLPWIIAWAFLLFTAGFILAAILRSASDADDQMEDMRQ